MNVVVTGGSKGIGKAIAMRFAAGGHNVFICARKLQDLELAAADIQKRFPAVKIKIKAVDLSVREQLNAFADWCLHYEALDVLVNNAGVYLPGSSIEEAEGSIESMMNINFYSAYYLTRRLVPAMIKRGNGHIFNMCSIASLDAYDGGGGYSISKFALLGFSKNLRHELKQHNIKVTSVFPGAVFTDSWSGFDNSNARIMEASDIAEMVFAAAQLSKQAVVEDIIIRPQEGDL